MTTLEQLVEKLQSVDSAWGFANDIPELKEGLSDLLHRLRSLEANVREIQRREVKL